MAARVRTVLVVDDEVVIVQIVTLLLESEGTRVLAAYRGDEALEVVRRERPDLVISDLMMPGLGGHELCQRIKADPELAHIPVVLMSAVHKLDVRTCDEDAFVPKPFDLETLLATIDRLLVGTG